MRPRGASGRRGASSSPRPPARPAGPSSPAVTPTELSTGCTRRTTVERSADASRPTPGAPPEFWPLDLTDFNGSDAYGWERQRRRCGSDRCLVFSTTSHPPTFDSDWRRLAAGVFTRRKAIRVRGATVRGLRFDLSYEVTAHGVVASVGTNAEAEVRVDDSQGNSVPSGSEQDFTNCSIHVVAEGALFGDSHRDGAL